MPASAEWTTTAASDYDPDGEVDLRGFTASLVVYAIGVLGTAAWARGAGHRLPDRFDAADLAIGALAVHKVSRLVTAASVTSPLRAPFTRFEGAAGAGEHHESARPGSQVRHTVGELITCPFCMDVWTATAYVAGLVVAPRPVRAVAAVMAVVTGADALQHVYQRLRG